ncbi:PREDICTED: uncharacterized protein LOC106817011 [Priapulus caudatus]|uniref:Uncharacterized protein LOC106817011 n=1 Tax=Priapulus caudatus TaxID=37621 RepID=A0ABM1EY72_PRICU|nr:PREDICTED: uncharacterized protein LOC106817011 [Priapulus caudatus]
MSSSFVRSLGACFRASDGATGLAIYWRTASIELADKKGYTLQTLLEEGLERSGLAGEEREAARAVVCEPSTSAALYARLKCRGGGAPFCVGNVHLDAMRMKLPNIQALQVASAANGLVSFAGSSSTPLLLCGTLGIRPSLPGYQLLKDGYLSSEMIEKLQAAMDVQLPSGEKKALVNLMWKSFQHTAANLRSAYASALGQEPDYTCYGSAERGGGGCHDYIWYSGDSLQLLGCLDTVAAATAGEHDVASSRHLPLKAKLCFL